VISVVDPTIINGHDFPSGSDPYASKNLFVLILTISLLLVTRLVALLDRSILHLSQSLSLDRSSLHSMKRLTP
jgi:hypothetical protein